MTKKKLLIMAIAVVGVLTVGSGGVYAYNSHVQQEAKAEQEAKKKAEKERLEAARAIINQEMDSLRNKLDILFLDGDRKFPSEQISQESIDAYEEELLTCKEAYQENKDISQEQKEQFELLEQDFLNVSYMYSVVNEYNSMYPEGQLVAPEAANEIMSSLKESLKLLEINKPEFFNMYIIKVNETEGSLAGQEAVEEAVYMIYDKETGTMVDGVTREQYQDVLEAVNTLPENNLKGELSSYLPVVDQVLRAQEEQAVRVAQGRASSLASESNVSKESTVSEGGRKSGGSNGKQSNSNGTSNNVGSGNGSSKNSSSGSFNKGTSGSNSSGSENSGGASSNGTSAGGSQSWTGEDAWGGDIKGGGTWSGGYVEGNDFPPAFE